MNKRGLIKYIFICVTAFISFYFLTTNETSFGNILGWPMVFAFIFALTIFMFFKMKKIKKFKFIYDVILMLLMIFTIGFFLYFIYSEISCSFDNHCMIDYESNYMMIFSMFLFIMLLFGFGDIFNKTNKANDILTIVASSLIILIHLRYYLDPSFIHRLNGGEQFIYYSYQYVTQNYLYFIIMYFVIMIHRRVNRIEK